MGRNASWREQKAQANLAQVSLAQVSLLRQLLLSTENTKLSSDIVPMIAVDVGKGIAVPQ